MGKHLGDNNRTASALASAKGDYGHGGKDPISFNLVNNVKVQFICYMWRDYMINLDCKYNSLIAYSIWNEEAKQYISDFVEVSIPRKCHQLYGDKLKHIVKKLQNPITRAKRLGEHLLITHNWLKFFGNQSGNQLLLVKI